MNRTIVTKILILTGSIAGLLLVSGRAGAQDSARSQTPQAVPAERPAESRATKHEPQGSQQVRRQPPAQPQAQEGQPAARRPGPAGRPQPPPNPQQRQPAGQGRGRPQPQQQPEPRNPILKGNPPGHPPISMPPRLQQPQRQRPGQSPPQGFTPPQPQPVQRTPQQHQQQQSQQPRQQQQRWQGTQPAPQIQDARPPRSPAVSTRPQRPVQQLPQSRPPVSVQPQPAYGQQGRGQQDRTDRPQSQIRPPAGWQQPRVSPSYRPPIYRRPDHFERGWRPREFSWQPYAWVSISSEPTPLWTDDWRMARSGSRWMSMTFRPNRHASAISIAFSNYVILDRATLTFSSGDVQVINFGRRGCEPGEYSLIDVDGPWRIRSLNLRGRTPYGPTDVKLHYFR